MKIDMIFLKKAKKKSDNTLDDLLKNGQNYPPRPWEVANGAHPYIFTCNQGEPEFWQRYLWMPFWCTLTEEQREEIKKEAPNQMWIAWLDLRSNFCETFLQSEKLKKEATQNYPTYFYYMLSNKHEPAGLWGVPLLVALATLMSSFPIYFFVFKYSSRGLHVFLFFLKAIVLAICTKYIIKSFKMRSPKMACRLVLIGCGLGYLISTLFMANFYDSDFGPIEFIINKLFFFPPSAGWVNSIRAAVGLLVWLGMFLFIVYAGAMSQVYQPYSETNGNWCRRLKLPHQRLAVNCKGLTPYQAVNDPYDPTEYELVDGIILPTKADPVGFFHFFLNPCLRIIIYFDELTDYNYIHVIYRKGLEAQNIEGPFRSINKAATQKIIKNFSNN